MKARSLLSLHIFAIALPIRAQMEEPPGYSLSFSASDNARTFDLFFRVDATEGFGATLPGWLELRKEAGVGNGHVTYGATFLMEGDFSAFTSIVQIGSLEGAEAGLSVVFPNGVFKVVIDAQTAKAEISGFGAATVQQARPYSGGTLQLSRAGQTLSALVGDEILLSESSAAYGERARAYLALTQNAGLTVENRVGFFYVGMTATSIAPSLAIERREDGKVALRWLQAWDARFVIQAGVIGANGLIEWSNNPPLDSTETFPGGKIATLTPAEDVRFFRVVGL